MNIIVPADPQTPNKTTEPLTQAHYQIESTLKYIPLPTLAFLSAPPGKTIRAPSLHRQRQSQQLLRILVASFSRT